MILQDKTGTIDAKIWDPNNAGIEDFDSMDYIEVYGDVTSFQECAASQCEACAQMWRR